MTFSEIISQVREDIVSINQNYIITLHSPQGRPPKLEIRLYEQIVEPSIIAIVVNRFALLM